MNKSLRQKVFEKFGGRCAYTGKELPPDWQIDHMESKRRSAVQATPNEINDIDNLMPSLRIVNHYKRSLGLEGFRIYMSDFHKRLGRLPKTTQSEATKKRIAYMHEVATAFGITTDKPFDGIFYFEI